MTNNNLISTGLILLTPTVDKVYNYGVPKIALYGKRLTSTRLFFRHIKAKSYMEREMIYTWFIQNTVNAARAETLYWTAENNL